MTSKASNDVIKQAQSLRQHFKMSIGRSICRQRPLQMSKKDYEFDSLPIRRSPASKHKLHKLTTISRIYPYIGPGSNIFKITNSKKHINSFTSPKFVKCESPLNDTDCFKVSPQREDYFSDKETKMKNTFIRKKQKFAIHLTIPDAVYVPATCESTMSRSSIAPRRN